MDTWALIVLCHIENFHKHATENDFLETFCETIDDYLIRLSWKKDALINTHLTTSIFLRNVPKKGEDSFWILCQEKLAQFQIEFSERIY
jgi:hypothetical protein